MTTYSASNHYGIVDFFLLSIWVDTSHIAVPLEEHASEHGWLVSSQGSITSSSVLVPAMPSFSNHSTYIACYEHVIKTDKRGYRALGDMERVFINKIVAYIDGGGVQS